MKNIAIFASGEGTNAEHLIRQFNREGSDIRVALLVYNRQEAEVRRRAEALGVRAVYRNRKDFADEEAMLRLLHEADVCFIALSGFLLLLPPYLLRAYPGRIVNIHPSLLPLHGGKGMWGIKVHADVLRHGEKESGITIHLIDGQYDHGRIVLQEKCPVLPDDTPETLEQRVHALEYIYYPKAVRYLVEQIS